VQPRTRLGAIPNALMRPFSRGLLRILLAIGQARPAWRICPVPWVAFSLQTALLQAIIVFGCFVPTEAWSSCVPHFQAIAVVCSQFPGASDWGR